MKMKKTVVVAGLTLSGAWIAAMALAAPSLEEGVGLGGFALMAAAVALWPRP